MIRVDCFDTQTSIVAKVVKGREHGLVEGSQIVFRAEPINGATSIQEPTVGQLPLAHPISQCSMFLFRR